MNEDYFAPVASRGDQVYVVRARHIRAKGGEYVLASGSRRDPRYIIVNVQRATATTYHALIYGWNRSEPRLGKQALRLSRSKWRPAYRVRGITYRPDEGRP